jgi:hypothetical protein
LLFPRAIIFLLESIRVIVLADAPEEFDGLLPLGFRVAFSEKTSQPGLWALRVLINRRRAFLDVTN